MKFLKRRARPDARVSFVLVDWSVRESFHLLHYLDRQDVPRDTFEVIIVEYYSKRSPAVEPFESRIDVWLLLQMPESCYYHKHLMYNAGIAIACGEIVVICDSDAMVREGFLGSILEEFEDDRRVALHVDEFRNVREDLYPFCFPSFDDVTGRGCINNVGGQTRGLAETSDPLHDRNYGACLAARRGDLLAIGGADEHLDYLGHICGPYDMTFRLVNAGVREVWHPREFLYHTWHPGQAGTGNYLGPHDGRHMSTTALEALATRRVLPYVQNASLRLLQDWPQADPARVEDLLLGNADPALWAIEAPDDRRCDGVQPQPSANYKGFRLRIERTRCVAHLISAEQLPSGLLATVPKIEAPQPSLVKEQIDRGLDRGARLLSTGGTAYGIASHARTNAVQFGTRVMHAAVERVGFRRRALQRLIVNCARSIVDRTLRSWSHRGLLAGTLFLVIRALGEAWRTLVHLPSGFAVLLIRAARAFERSLTGANARLADLVRRFLLEERRRAGSLASLVINLHFLGHDREARRKVKLMAVMVDTPASAHYLYLLSTLRFVPKARIVHVRTQAQLQAELRGVVAERAASVHSVIVVDRECYQKHYATFGAVGVGVGLLIV